MDTFINIITISVAFLGGYAFCVIKYQPRKLMEAMDLLIQLLNKTITPEEAKEIFKEIWPGD